MTSTRLAAKCAEEIRRRGVFIHSERQCLELFGKRRGGVVIDAGDAAAPLVEHRERLQHVVELRRSEVDGDALIAADRSGMFEVADTVLVENDLAHRQILAPGGTCGAANCAFGATWGAAERAFGAGGLV